MNPAFVPLIYVVAFIAVVVLVQTFAGVFLESRDKTTRVNRRLTMLDSGMDPNAVYSALVRQSQGFRLENATFASVYARAQLYFRQAGLTVSPLKVLAVAGGAAAAIWLAGIALITARGEPIFLNAVLSLIGACTLSGLGALYWVRRARQQRIKQFSTQLPLALDVMTRALRAGHPVLAAVQLSATELGDPIGSELGLIVDETNYGADFRTALGNFAQRTGSQDAHFLAVSINIQSETGGNLAEILEGLARVIRERLTLVKRVNSLASEGRASAYVLSVLPVLLISFQFSTNPSFYTSKFPDPIFWPTVAGVLVMYVIGWLIIQRIVNSKY